MADNIPVLLAAHNLADYGRLLDSMDSRRLPPDARHYRKAALFAAKLLRQFGETTAVQEVLALSPALQALYESIQWDAAAQKGNSPVSASVRDVLAALAEHR